MTVGRIFAKIYIFKSLFWVFFKNRKNSGLTPGQNNDPVTRTWKMTQMTHWPGDPMTQFHVWPTCIANIMQWTYFNTGYRTDWSRPRRRQLKQYIHWVVKCRMTIGCGKHEAILMKFAQRSVWIPFAQVSESSTDFHVITFAQRT